MAILRVNIIWFNTKSQIFKTLKIILESKSMIKKVPVKAPKLSITMKH